MNPYRYSRPPGMPRHQRGVVLVVALIFLLLLTILAVSASSGSLLQEKMVSATRNGQLAEWGAETALRGAEWTLFQTSSNVGGHIVCTSDSISSDGCVRYNNQSGLYAAGGAVAAFRSNAGWQAGSGRKYENPGFDFKDPRDALSDAAFDTAGLADYPQYLVEDLGPALPPGAGTAQETGTTGLRSGGAGKINIHTYRITARATGGNDKAVRVLQSTFDAQTSN